MTTWFTGKNTKTHDKPQAATAMRVQSAVAGKPIALLYGLNRVAGNLIWYGDFIAIPIQNNQGAGGGKGGGSTGGGGKGSQGSVTYNYRTSFAIALGETQLDLVLAVYNNKAINNFAGLGFGLAPGTADQGPWGYLSAAHPDQALTYRRIAYAYMAGFDLGSQTELPNFSFQYFATIRGGVPGRHDASPRAIIIDFLTDPVHGVGFPVENLDTAMTAYHNYTTALGLYVSPALVDQREASAFLADLFRITNSSPRFSGGVLTVVPWGDDPVFANGANYVPNTTPLYDLTVDDFLGGDPSIINIHRKPRDQVINTLGIEYTNDADNYDPDLITARDSAGVFEYGVRADQRDCMMITNTATATLSGFLQLVREQIQLTYKFRLPAKFILIDVEDIVTLTLDAQALFRQAVRVKNIEENDDGSLSFEAEEYLGTAGAPLYGEQATSGYVPNYNVDPGEINEPIIFEPSDLLGAAGGSGGGLQVWAAISGVDKANWGGCNVYASYDGITYQAISEVHGPARMGVLTDVLPAFPVNPTGPNIDEGNGLLVSMLMSGATLLPGTQQDMLSLNTACYVGGEIVAYRDATLTGTNAYTLAGLNRGAYGTEAQMISAHPIGTPFARLDQGIAKVAYDQNRIGSTIYLKFQSFNVWGGGLKDLADIPAFSYTLTGSALASPLPIVQNVRVVYEDGFTKIWWDPVTDFRSGIRYKIFRGPSFLGAEQVFDNAHAPFIAFGSGTYWIIAYAQPVPELIVTSEDPVSIVISGNMLIKNLVFTSNQQTAGWPGTMSNGVAKDGIDPNAVLRLGGAGNILDDPDILANPDVLNYGGVISEGTYHISTADVIDVGYVADCSVNVTWLGTGAPVGQNILQIDDILATPDILGSASTQYVTVKVQIRTAMAAEGDLYESPDLYGEDDLYRGGVEWSEWQDYTPGVYRARLVDLRLILQTADPQTIAYALGFSYEVSVPARIDHYPNVAVPGSGVTIVFEPDDASVAAPFNGGPPVGGIMAQPLPFVTHSAVGAAGLTVVVDSFDLSQITYHYVNGAGTPVDVASDSVVVTGY